VRARRVLSLCLLAASACGDAGREDPVIARLDGAPIRRSEVSAPAAFRLYLHDVQSYALLEEETKRLVDERVLGEAARREGIAPAALLARIEAAGPPVSDADVERYLAEHRDEAAASVPPDALRARVRHYLEERGRIERRLAFLEELRQQAGFEWLLARPVAPRVRIDAPQAPARGPADARVTIVHFASFGSRASARSAQALERLAAEFPGDVRWLHVNLLRDGDEDEGGRRGAELAFAAQDAGRFWELHDALFARAGHLDADALAAAAVEAGLDADPLARADRAALLRRLEGDLGLARRAGALREPTLFLNGRYWSGLGAYPGLRKIFQEELERAVDGVASGR
jgi:protein-disulfide isomerase